MIAYGKQVFFYIIRHHKRLIKKIYLAKEIDKGLFQEIQGVGIAPIRLDAKKAQAMAKGGNHQGFLLEIEEIPPLHLKEMKAFNRLLVLHEVSDSGNIGGIVRTAYCLGIDGVILSGLSSFSIEGALRTSSGALLELPFSIVRNPLDLIQELKEAGFTLYGAQGGERIPAGEFAKKRALFMGSEGRGLGARVKAKMDMLLGIEMERDFDSLNVGVAAAILIDRMR